MKFFTINNITRSAALSALVVFTQCSGGDPAVNANAKMVTAEPIVTNQQKISDEAIGEIMRSIPSPIEISMLIKESGSDYDNAMLNSEDNYRNYSSSFKKALNLGIYGADLGYINIYEKNTDALAYLSAIKSLADELNIGQFYDFNTIKRLASNTNNIDSLLLITTMNMERINTFLHEQKRSEQCVLILVGGWMEAVHISCEVYKKTKKAEILEKIGEQKIVLDQLVLLLSNYKEQGNIAFLAGELQKLKAVYDKITISYTYSESKMEEVDGVLMIVNESTSKVNITPEQAEEISKILETLRTKITA